MTTSKVPNVVFTVVPFSQDKMEVKEYGLRVSPVLPSEELVGLTGHSSVQKIESNDCFWKDYLKAINPIFSVYLCHQPGSIYLALGMTK